MNLNSQTTLWLRPCALQAINSGSVTITKSHPMGLGVILENRMVVASRLRTKDKTGRCPPDPQFIGWDTS